MDMDKWDGIVLSRQCPLQSEYSRTGANHVTADNGLESVRPCEACSLSDVTVEGSRPAGSFRRFHLIIWLGDQIWDHLYNIDKANCSCHRVKLSCTNYRLCSASVVCRNSFTNKEGETGDEEQR